MITQAELKSKLQRKKNEITKALSFYRNFSGTIDE